MEDYAAKMQLKSDAALREYVTGYAQYRDEAVLAALAELRRRGQPAAEEAHLRPLLEEAVRQQQAAAPPTPVTAPPANEDEASLPELYSPTGIAVISATVSVLAGGLLLALNLLRLRRGGAAAGLVLFVLAYLVGELLVLRWLLEQRQLTLLTPFLLDLPLILVYLWWFWPRYVGTYRFRARNWLLPLGLCLLLKVGAAYLIRLNPVLTHLMEEQMKQLQNPQ